MQNAIQNVIRNAVTPKGAVLALAVFLAGCAPKAVQFDPNNVPDTPHCEFMKDVCKEAKAFQSQYEAMSAEEREDAKVILNAYIEQCEGAQEMCRKSAAQ